MRIKEEHYLIIIFALILIVRLPSFPIVVIDWDETGYFTVAQDIADGGIIYKTSWGHKGPILFLLFTPVIWIFGNSIIALRAYTTICLIISTYFVYNISKRIYEQPIARLIPPFIYGAFYSNNAYQGLSSNAELFMMLPAIIAIDQCLKYFLEENRLKYLILSGFLSATAIFIKTSVFFTIILIPLFLIARNICQPDHKRLLKELFSYGMGIIILSSLILFYLTYHGTIQEFIDTRYYSYEYVNTIPFRTAFNNLFFFVLIQIFFFIEPLTTFAAISMIIMLVLIVKTKQQYKNKAIALLALTICSTLGVFLGRNMYPHYFLQMALPFALIIAFPISLIKMKKPGFINEGMITLFLIPVIITAMIISYTEFTVIREHYMNAPEVRVSEYINSKTTRRDTIFVLGGQMIIHFLSERKAPTRFFNWYHHTPLWREINGLEAEVLDGFNKNKPRYMIYNPRLFKVHGRVEYLEVYMYENYHLETTIDEYSIYRRN